MIFYVIYTRFIHTSLTNSWFNQYKLYSHVEVDCMSVFYSVNAQCLATLFPPNFSFDCNL